jgi:hypothetical protein
MRDGFVTYEMVVSAQENFPHYIALITVMLALLFGTKIIETIAS